MNVFWFTVLHVLFLSTLTRACDTSTSPAHLGARVMDADLVFLGRVIDHVQGPRSDIRFANIQIQCILKNILEKVDGKLKVRILSSTGGGRCIDNKFDIGKVYYVFVRWPGVGADYYQPVSAELPGDDPKILQDVCGLGAGVEHPSAESASSSKCPDLTFKPCPTTTTIATTRPTKRRLTTAARSSRAVTVVTLTTLPTSFGSRTSVDTTLTATTGYHSGSEDIRVSCVAFLVAVSALLPTRL